MQLRILFYLTFSDLKEILRLKITVNRLHVLRLLMYLLSISIIKNIISPIRSRRNRDKSHLGDGNELAAAVF